jgi:hypothetical protein
MDVYVREEIRMGSSSSIIRLPPWQGEETFDGGDVEIIKNRAVVQQRVPPSPLRAAGELSISENQVGRFTPCPGYSNRIQHRAQNRAITVSKTALDTPFLAEDKRIV